MLFRIEVYYIAVTDEREDLYRRLGKSPFLLDNLRRAGMAYPETN